MADQLPHARESNLKPELQTMTKEQEEPEIRAELDVLELMQEDESDDSEAGNYDDDDDGDADADATEEAIPANTDTNIDANDIFMPTYEWQKLPSDIEAPIGMEIEDRVERGISSRWARMPPRWTLSAYVVPYSSGSDAPTLPRCNVDVARKMLICDMILEIHNQTGPACNLLTMFVEDNNHNRFIDLGHLNDPKWASTTVEDFGWDLFAFNFVVLVNLDRSKLGRDDEGNAEGTASPPLPPNKPPSGDLNDAKQKDAGSSPPELPPSKPTSRKAKQRRTRRRKRKV